MSQKLTIRIVRSAAKAIAEAADWWQVNMLLAHSSRSMRRSASAVTGALSGWMADRSTVLMSV
ncbi:MAG: hypothetical protein NTX45_06560 [Proteobacteria bacterium]|nr:hypothetical protein [Pseudomonadota bacterium]